MKIKQDPVTGLWAREDGAILMPPCRKFPYYRWTFGNETPDGYRIITYKGKHHKVHRLICRAFHGLPPPGKPEIDHIDRDPANNKEDNLRYSDRSMNSTNRGCVDKAIAKYGVRACEGRKAYNAAYAADKRDQGLVMRKDSTGKWGWYPRIRTKPPV